MRQNVYQFVDVLEDSYLLEKSRGELMEMSTWKDDLSIGIDKIDSQHQKLIGLLDQCIQKSKLSKAEFEPVLKDMKSLADTHFRAEEQLMQTLDYPELEEHQKQHRLFEENLGLLETEVNNWEKLTIITLTSLLRDWFVQHILDLDRRIGAYRRAKG
jgi:hemerythrin